MSEPRCPACERTDSLCACNPQDLRRIFREYRGAVLAEDAEREKVTRVGLSSEPTEAMLQECVRAYEDYLDRCYRAPPLLQTNAMRAAYRAMFAAPVSSSSGLQSELQPTPLTIDVDKDCRRYRWIKANMKPRELFPSPEKARPRVTIDFPGTDRRTGKLEWDLPGAERLDAAIDEWINADSGGLNRGGPKA